MKSSSAPPSADTATHARLTLARAEGLHVWDTDGRRYLDATSGAFCVQLGYTRPDLVRAMSDAAVRLPHARPTRFDSEEGAAYQRELLAAAGAPYSRVWLTSSGSEAVDVALKIACRYQSATGHPERTAIRSVEGHFHGATLGALGVTGIRGRRVPFEGLLGVGEGGAEDGRAGGGRAGQTAHGSARDVAALIRETIPAIGLGVQVPSPEELAQVRGACDESGSLWIADEVLTGFGRTGSLFAWQRIAPRHAPDLVAFGKGAGAGFAPLAGVLVADRVAQVLDRDKFEHRQTYAGNPIVSSVGRQVLRAFAEEEIEARVRAAERALERALQRLTKLPLVRAVRGLGYLWGIALAEHPGVAAEIAEGCRSRGVLVHAGASELGGSEFLLVAPPLIAGEPDFAEIAEAIEGAATAIE